MKKKIKSYSKLFCKKNRKIKKLWVLSLGKGGGRKREREREEGVNEEDVFFGKLKTKSNGVSKNDMKK